MSVNTKELLLVLGFAVFAFALFALILLAPREVAQIPAVASPACAANCHPLPSRVVGDRCECLVGGAP